MTGCYLPACTEILTTKPRPNDCNIATQHIATMPGATSCTHLATMLRRVAMCCDMLGVVGSNLKPRPNNRNSSTQHIATLLAQYFQAPAERSQHFNATCPNIVGRNMLRTFSHHVARCCDMLPVENRTSVHALNVAPTWPNDYNMMQHPQICCVAMLRSFGRGLKLVKFFMQHLWMLHHVVVVWPGSCNNVAPGHAH